MAKLMRNHFGTFKSTRRTECMINAIKQATYIDKQMGAKWQNDTDLQAWRKNSVQIKYPHNLKWILVFFFGVGIRIVGPTCSARRCPVALFQFGRNVYSIFPTCILRIWKRRTRTPHTPLGLWLGAHLRHLTFSNVYSDVAAVHCTVYTQ